MEDGFFSSDAHPGTVSNTSRDFNFTDELLPGSYWLEALEHPDFLHSEMSSSTIINSSYFLPSTHIEITSNPLTSEPTEKNHREKPGFLYNSDSVELRTELLDAKPLRKTETVESYPNEKHRDAGEIPNISSELNGRNQCEPKAHTQRICPMKLKLIRALEYIQESSKYYDVLVQMWVPIRKGDKRFLTTSGQPFCLDPNSQRLLNYRTVSTNYQFPIEKNTNQTVGLPGRVFLARLPEWTPDVRYFSQDEYPRIDYAQCCNVRGTLALPVFERETWSCLGVMEVVMTSPKINYQCQLLDNICKALQAVDLTSSEVSNIPHPKVKNDSYQAFLPAILEILMQICKMHNLPLAQTWVPCIEQGEKGRRHCSESYRDYVSTSDIACFINDSRMQGFHEACAEHHLFRGQGVVGQVFLANQPCFSSDVTSFSKIEYPLSHHARFFGLRGAFAIPFQDSCTKQANYVLEFFLPVDCSKNEEQIAIVNSISSIVQWNCQSFLLLKEKEHESKSIWHIDEAISYKGILSMPLFDEDEKYKRERIQIPFTKSTQELIWMEDKLQTLQKGKQKVLPAPMQLEFDKWVLEGLYGPNLQDRFKRERSCTKKLLESSMVKSGANGVSSSLDECKPFNGKSIEKKHTKMEKSVSLEVLQRYFAGSLKDAAKSIGVCPTTLKRICRQHGITQWPSRKIKKVNHSLRKLQGEIESVQETERNFQISDLYRLNSPDLSSTFFESEFHKSKPLKAKSPSSSCSQCLSHCCSTRFPGIESSSLNENQMLGLEKVHNKTDSRDLALEEPRPICKICSQKSLSYHPSLPSSLKVSPLVTDKGRFRVKVTCGEDKVRFSMQPSWTFQDLQQEIGKRFDINDWSLMYLKYLDDDSNWVLLKSDDDLRECIDLYKSSSARAIKFSTHPIFQTMSESV